MTQRSVAFIVVLVVGATLLSFWITGRSQSSVRPNSANTKAGFQIGAVSSRF